MPVAPSNLPPVTMGVYQDLAQSLYGKNYTQSTINPVTQMMQQQLGIVNFQDPLAGIFPGGPNLGIDPGTLHIPGADRQRLLAQAAAAVGVPQEWAFDPATFAIIQHESSWNPSAKNPHSTAFGLGQFLRQTWHDYIPEVPYGTANTYWQLVGFFRYVRSNYGSPSNAWAFWQRNKWY